MIENVLPDSSRVWIYQSDRKFNAEQITLITNQLDEFVNSWEAHGASLSAAAEILFKQFIVIFVDEGVQSPTGCSIDKSVALIKSIEAETGADLMNRMNIAFGNEQDIKVVKMTDFQYLIKTGEIDENTQVYNNLVQTKADFLSSWKVPLKHSWHAQLLK